MSRSAKATQRLPAKPSALPRSSRRTTKVDYPGRSKWLHTDLGWYIGERYLLAGDTLAVVTSRKCRRVVTVAPKSMVEVPEPLDGQSGLIQVTLNGDIAFMFAEDIRDRGKRCSDEESKDAKVVSA